MIDELEQERIDGEAARQVLDNPAFQKAWAEAENSIVAQMADVKMRDTEMHTRLILALQTLAAVRRHIFTTMETGQLATVQLREPNVVSRVFGR